MLNALVGSQSLSGKVALITGEARSRGGSLAARLAANGASVALTYGGARECPADEVKAIVEAGGTALAIQADPADVAAMKSAVEQTVRELGRPDILVNHVGIAVARSTGPVMPKDLQLAVAAGVRELSVVLQESLRHLKEDGRIINVCSIESEFASFGGAMTYSLARAAVAGLSQSLARELCTGKVKINTIMPGHGCRGTEATSRDLRRNTHGRILGRRHAGTEGVAQLVVFLAMPETCFFTGVN